MSEFILDDGTWYKCYPVMDKNGDESVDDKIVTITDVPVNELLEVWEELVNELSENEVELANVKEDHNNKEFEILTKFDFKKIYGKDNEKIRKAHVHNELLDLDNKISDLELSANWIKSYIPLLKEVIRSKQ